MTELTGKIALLTTGSEITDGRIADTNSQFLAQLCCENGLVINNILSCPDNVEAIKESIKFLLTSADYLLITGGIGPTLDDCTREAVAKFIDKELILNDSILDELKSRFEKIGTKYHLTNNKQALLPEGAELIDNPRGTAHGFRVELRGITAETAKTQQLIVLPGVPEEMKPMFKESVLPFLVAKSSGIQPTAKRTLRIFGVSESSAAATVEQLQLPSHITVSFRAFFPEIQILLSSSESQEEVCKAAQQVKLEIGVSYVFSESSESGYEKTLHDLLIAKNITIATAESCTGGYIGQMLTSISGSSAYYLGGIVSYSNASKIALLGVDSAAIDSYGAVSKQVAKSLATGVRERFGSQVGLSVTGIAGPTGGTESKPVGTFFIGFADCHGVKAYPQFYPSTRQRIRKLAAYSALEVVRQQLL